MRGWKDLTYIFFEVIPYCAVILPHFEGNNSKSFSYTEFAKKEVLQTVRMKTEYLQEFHKRYKWRYPGKSYQWDTLL